MPPNPVPPLRLPPGLLAALPLVAGAVTGTFSTIAAWPALVLLGPICGLAAAAWLRRWPRAVLAALAAGFFAAAVALSSEARARAIKPSLRALLDERFGGFALSAPGPEPDLDPLAVSAILTEDAAVADGFVSMRANVTGVEIGGIRHSATGSVIVSVNGALASENVAAWVAGRTVRMHAAFRRPAHYLNEGVADFERDLALDGTTLFASVKSGLLVEVTGPGSRAEETAARVRAYVRRAVTARVAPHDPVSAAIVTAVLIGDRTALPDAVRERLQDAGTYHVIAISGGNIAILAAAALAFLALAGIRGRPAAVLAAAVLLAYAQVVTSGPSVWRATSMAVVYCSARALDLGSAPWQVVSVAAALMLVLNPLDVRDAGFVLTFGATAALLEGARWGRTSNRRGGLPAWVAASLAASVSTELGLLPVSAEVFSRVTFAGILLNLAAVPLMAVVQIAGMTLVIADGWETAARLAATTAHAAAFALVGSAGLLDIAHWLAIRVAAPGLVLVATYYGALAVLVWARRRLVRGAAGLVFVVAFVAIVSGVRLPAGSTECGGRRLLCLTMFDVGQGESLLVEVPGGSSLLVDAGGAPFGRGAFDMGSRVLAPALWARGIARLDALVVTHGDPDHIGGAESVLRDFAPRALLEGIRVSAHVPMQQVRNAAARRAAPVAHVQIGDVLVSGQVRIRVLHPAPPDWERQRVRNDDSVVLEILYGDVAILLTGDVSAEIERAIVPELTPARVRILKVAHHGSRTSTSRGLLDAWRPQIALVSSGRGNSFGHPAPEVLERLESIGAAVFRTDRHGRITVHTDGDSVRITTFIGAKHEPR